MSKFGNAKFVWKLIAVTLVVVAWTASATGQQITKPKPNLSGTWKLNLAKSASAPGMKPATQTEVLTVSGDSLTVAFTAKTEAGPVQYKVNLTIGADAVAIAPELFRDTDFMKVQDARSEWQDDNLIVTMNATFKDDPVTIRSTYTLSVDGKTLTKVSSVDRDVQPFTTREVYEKA